MIGGFSARRIFQQAFREGERADDPGVLVEFRPAQIIGCRREVPVTARKTFELVANPPDQAGCWETPPPMRMRSGAQAAVRLTHPIARYFASSSQAG